MGWPGDYQMRGRMTPERWSSLLRGLGVGPDDSTYEGLSAAYAERHRAYHTGRHIDECLARFDEVRALAGEPFEVECALWFHDAIYDPMSSNNEARSADRAGEFLQKHRMAPYRIERVRRHVMATRHVEPLSADDSGLVVDIDLSILGSAPERYAEFERDVRREYRWVPATVYRRKRAEILRSFLERPRIYHFDRMADQFELAARRNVAGAVRTLTQS
jgi:predicted metal-dependent HD superfamily phosphohydrolase